MKYENIYYTNNSNSNQTLDVFMPEEINGRIPVLIYIHGGVWNNRGRKELYAEDNGSEQN